MSCFIKRRSALYVKSALDGREYCKTNGQLARHLASQGFTAEEYVERFIDSASKCNHCPERSKLESKTWHWLPTCGAQACTNLEIAASKLRLYADSEKKATTVAKFRSSLTPEIRARIRSGVLASQTPEALNRAKLARRATCERLYGDSTYSNRDKIALTKSTTPLEVKARSYQQMVLTQRKLCKERYGTRWWPLQMINGFATSKLELDIVSKLAQRDVVSSCLHEKGQLILTDGYRQYAYDVALGSRIIEINGDFWHANPNRYSAESVLSRGSFKTTAAKKWKKDARKLKIATDQGFEVLVVWESEYRQNPQEVIERCDRWLAS